MKVISRLTAVAAAIVLAAPMGLSAQALPKAEELFAKHVAAIGGKDAVMKITSMKQTGKFEMAAAGMVAEVENSMAAPNRSATKISLPGMGELLQGYDGTNAWDVNPMQGPRLLADKELQMRKDGADFYCQLLHTPECYSSAQTMEQADFNGEKAYKVKAVLKSGREEFSYFSVATGLLIGESTTVDGAMGTVEMVSTESDYKAFGALKFGTRKSVTMGPQTFVLTLTNVTYNDVLPTAFALPDAVKALVKP